MSRTDFVAAMTEWLNATLVPAPARVGPDTLLFERGLIDSIAILKLIAWTERAVGQRIPDEQIRMDNFASVRRIAACFLKEGVDVVG